MEGGGGLVIDKIDVAIAVGKDSVNGTGEVGEVGDEILALHVVEVVGEEHGVESLYLLGWVGVLLDVGIEDGAEEFEGVVYHSASLCCLIEHSFGDALVGVGEGSLDERSCDALKLLSVKMVGVGGFIEYYFALGECDFFCACCHIPSSFLLADAACMNCGLVVSGEYVFITHTIWSRVVQRLR